MRVLLTTPTFPPYNSGLGNAVQQQAVALTLRGCEVVIATGGDARSTQHDKISNATVEIFPVSGSDFILNPLRGDVASYRDFLTSATFDVVVFNAWQIWSTDIGLRCLSKISGRKYVYSHCVSTNMLLAFQPVRSILRYLAWRPYWWRMSHYMRKLDGLIFLAEDGCDSRFDDAKLARRLGLKSQIIPNTVSPDALSVCEQGTRSFAERSYVLAVGSYDPLKGHDFVIRAYARSTLKNKIPLRIFGQAFTPFTETLRVLAQNLGVQDDYIQLNEGVSGLALIHAYGEAYAILSGSQTECQPLVLLDAMATGTPFIARGTGCIPSLSGGYAVMTEDEMALKLEVLSKDISTWQHVQKMGRLAALKDYHPRQVGDALMSKVIAGEMPVYAEHK